MLPFATTPTLFGIPLPTPAATPLAPALAARLAARMAEAAAALKAGAPVAVASGTRADARRYLDARRTGALRLPSITLARTCDEHAHALLHLTVDAPAAGGRGELLVA